MNDIFRSPNIEKLDEDQEPRWFLKNHNCADLVEFWKSSGLLDRLEPEHELPLAKLLESAAEFLLFFNKIQLHHCGFELYETCFFPVVRRTYTAIYCENEYYGYISEYSQKLCLNHHEIDLNRLFAIMFKLLNVLPDKSLRNSRIDYEAEVCAEVPEIYIKEKAKNLI